MVKIRECGCRADSYHDESLCKLGVEEAKRRNTITAEHDKQVLKWMRGLGNEWDS